MAPSAIWRRSRRARPAWAAIGGSSFGPKTTSAIEAGLAVLPAGAVFDRQRANLLLILSIAAAVAGDEERAAACHRELAAITEAGGEFVHRVYIAWALWSLWLPAWRRGDLDRATELLQQSLRLRRNDRMGTTLCVEPLAWAAASGRRYERATVLLGAAAGLWRSVGANPEGFYDLAGYHGDCERQTRQALGEAAFQATYHRGLNLPADDAVAYPLQQPSAKPPEKVVSDGAPLTPRELQVARLIAGGRSNKQIAAELVISQRTAENHVEHILTKLGFTSRAQVAAWAAASQPDGGSA
jgi:DNA-binding CsgD family transcriptional regulator